MEKKRFSFGSTKPTASAVQNLNTEVAIDEGGPGIKLYGKRRPPLVSIIYGRSKTGKTALAFDFPGTPGIVVSDANTRETVEKCAEELGKNYYITNRDFSAADAADKATRMAMQFASAEKSRALYQPIYKQWLDNYVAMCEHPKTDYVIIDGMKFVTELILFTHTGRRDGIKLKDRAPIDNDVREVMQEARRHGKHLVVTFFAKNRWLITQEDGKDKFQKIDSLTQIDGGNQDKLEYFAGLVIETIRVMDHLERDEMKTYLPLGEEGSAERKANIKRLKPGVFLSRLVNCNRNASLIGTERSLFWGDGSNFSEIIDRVWGEFDEEQWLTAGKKGK